MFKMFSVVLLCRKTGQGGSKMNKPSRSPLATYRNSSNSLKNIPVLSPEEDRLSAGEKSVCDICR